ncbi:MAG: hypothetical protein ACJ8AG_24800, partial [Ktedonobacteraceae bacterium]
QKDFALSRLLKCSKPQVSWPGALRAVRGWLEPWIMLRRYWSGWSPLPPPPALQLLLSWLEQGHAIPLYNSA